ncbi:pyridoxamine 5'-phosphate oxidase family protein [Saccharothrix australiensis]|uniref:Nitroimidazol reductase NimA-like FMN-containing flavoprotein (Pyridoxamine 5'-phosphate oxidase superfamily) n=1 Tax=Saccharothrix australiensis TaxID=2072 RepID=A0A495W511_9PSEU|nr:pyridoxamine 5'-phosphate oxidase family protein [Saccharothrix australiensis]RKT56137.1 nitroimidazol reductase NimA-like FMN-containing flavoprotein (pyridoxamine 5'-phosphate oxidase superfamily) [Saccharothrix australiensis]
MSRGDREAFLHEARVGVLGVTDGRGDRAPLLVPVWYSYEPGGDVLVQTGRSSLKAKLIRESGRFSLCAQHETPPYRYVSVEGPVVAVDDPLDAADFEALARRYLDPTTAEKYLAANRAQLAEDVAFRMRPQHWRTADFAAFAENFG